MKGGIILEQYVLRKAVEGDIELLFQWANEKEVRKNSFQSDSIDWDTHYKWFQKLLQASDREIYIYCKDEEAIGQIRLEFKETCAEIHYSIDKKYRGQGHGERMLMLVEERIKKEQNEIKYIDAEVKKNNIASRKKFEQLGYESFEVIKYRKNITTKIE